jgi:hypothetical protein
MNRELERIWKEAVVAQSRNSVRIGGVLTEIQTKHLANTNLEHYRYANPLSVF